jgi:hypothetical protein
MQVLSNKLRQLLILTALKLRFPAGILQPLPPY